MNKIITTPWKRFLGLISLDKKDIFQIANYSIFQGVIALSLPLGIQAIINLLQGAQISVSWIVLVILVTLGVIMYGVLQLMQMRIIETIQQRIFTRASFDLIYRFPKIKMKELNNLYLPELANRFFDTLTIQKGLSKLLIDVPTAFLQIVFALILLSIYHPFFIIFGLILLVLIYLVFKYTINVGLETSLIESKTKYRVAHWLQEVARSVIGFKLSGKSSLAIDKNDVLVSKYIEARESHFKILVLQLIQMIGFKVLMTAGLLVIGGILVLNQQMNIGQFVAAEIIIILVMNSVEKLTLGLESFYDVLTSIEKIGQVVDKDMENQIGEKPSLDNMTIRLENLSYKFSDSKDVLNNIDLIINPKDRILLHGISGSGKSTLLRILTGIYEPTKGSITINNQSLNSISLNHYRSKLGISLTDQTPFEGSIRENITFGDKKIDDEEILKVFERLKLTTFLKKQKKGLNTIIHPEGRQIPNTIAKKIILARAIITKPKLLILEDSLDQIAANDSSEIIDYLLSPENPWAIIVVGKNEVWKNKSLKEIELENGAVKK